MCETAKAVIQPWCGLGVESRALILEPQALPVLPVLQPHLCSQRREFREGMTGPLQRPGDVGGSWAHLQKLSDLDSQCLVSIPTVGYPLWGLHPHCGVSIPTAGPPSSTAGPPSPPRGLHPHYGVSIPAVGSLSPLWCLHSLSGVSTPLPGTPSLSPGFPMPRASSVTHVDSWARFGAAQEGLSVRLPPTEASLCLWTLMGDWSLPLWSLPRVQLCPARPGLVALERLRFCCFQELRHRPGVCLNAGSL